MPPPHLPPPERGESESTPTPGIRRHIGKLFWVGVAIAPIAALLLVLGSGVGPLRAAAVLAVFSVVIIGLSVVLRDDAAMVRDDVEEQLRTEVDRLRSDIDSLRRGVEVSVHRELERVHRELEATRRDSVLRTESTRLGRLTGALPPGEDDYPAESRGRAERPVRALTARNDLPSPDPGYDWFGGTEEDAEGGQRKEPIRYEAGTYGSARAGAEPASAADAPAGNWPQRPPEADSRARRGGRRDADAAQPAAQSPAGARSAGTEYGRRRADAEDAENAAGRYQSFQSGTYSAGAYEAEAADEGAGRRRSGRRRAPEDDEPAYELIEYDDAPPAYTPQRLDAGVYGSRSAGTDQASRDDSGEVGTIDYTEYWARSSTPRPEPEPRRDPDARRAAPARRDDDRSSASEWSSWRETDSQAIAGQWDTGSQRYNRDDPQVITGAITGDVFDVPYTVGGQTLAEPEFGAEPGFGAGNGFGAGSGFGAGNGFGGQRWDELPDVPPAPQWPPAGDGGGARTDQPSAEFELPSLEHLPPAGAAPSDEASGAGGRHARHAPAPDDRGQYRSW